tara:strand:+ start:103142 stop:104782 length:1641 start_codon:yes stop_codon:yes gene_type:complete
MSVTLLECSPAAVFSKIAVPFFRIAERLTRIVGGLLLLVSSMHASVNAQPASRPNVLVIMADDMGYSDLGCFGGEIRTPHLDRLAEDGLRFTNFYSENMCWVSRVAMLTGVYHRTSMFEGSIHPRCVTMPEVLGDHGYQTLMSGKWHLAGKQYRIYPGDRGFDQFYGFLGGAVSFYWPAYLTRNRTDVQQEAIKDPDYYITDAITDEGIRMLRESDAGKPLFMYVAYNAAHWPLHARDEDIAAYKGRYAGGWDQLRQERLARMKQLGIVSDTVALSPRNENVPAWDDESHQAWQQRRMEVYAAQVTSMDRGIGRLMDALKDTGRFDNTLVFFTVDNGGCHVEYEPDRKGDYLPKSTRDGRPMRPGNLPEIMPGPEDTYQSYGHGWANASNTPYRMFKKFDHEGGVRTPMIAHWPAGIEAKGKLVPAVSHLIDIMPTVLEVTGATHPNKFRGQDAVQVDGHSLAAAFRSESLQDHQTLFFHHASGKALRHERWKLVAAGGGDWELYDLKEDPAETMNLAKQRPAQVKRLAKMWESESARLLARAKLK